MRDAELEAPKLDRKIEWVSDAVAEMISRLGFKYMALVPGASFRGLHDSVVNYLGNNSPTLVVCLHEAQAVSIAEGYGRALDEPMAVALHSNVGLMNASMAVYNAWCSRTPMLLMGATGPVDAHNRRPWIDWVHTSKDQAAIVRSYVKWDDQPASSESTIESLLRANQIMRTAPCGPVYICLDAPMQEKPIAEGFKIPPISRFQPALPPTTDKSVIREILSAVKTAKFPVLLVGRVSRLQADWDRRIKLAEALGAAVLTTLHNPAAFPTDHPLHIAAPCFERTPEHEMEIIKRADLIISLDWHDLAGFLRSRLGDVQTQSPSDARIIHCSPDSYIANGWSMDHQALPAADIFALSHPDTLTAQLLDEIEDSGDKTPLSVGSNALGKITHWTRLPSTPATATSGTLPLRELAGAISDFATSRPVTFARLPISWPGNVCHFADPLAYMGKDAGGAVGTGPGHIVGTALALKDSGRLVIGVIGDGDFLMGANALWTASAMNIPLLMIIANNRSFYNDVVHQETVARHRGRPVENKWIGQDLSMPTTDIAGIARSQGFAAEGPVSNVSDFMRVLMNGVKEVDAGGRFLIDVHIAHGYA